MKVQIKCSDQSLRPTQAHPGDAGLDLKAAEDGDIPQWSIRKVPTGISVAIGWGHEAQIRPRSGLAYKHGLTIVNSPGTIDEGYRGEIQIIMANLTDTPFTYKKGDRLAQMVINELPKVEVEYVDELPSSSRGTSGFGSSGVK